jgi:hypothetical protein
VVESDVSDERISILCNFEQTVDWRCWHDVSEQASGKGLHKRPNSKEFWGVLFFGRRPTIGSYQPPLIIARCPTFQEMCNSEQTPDTAWVS